MGFEVKTLIGETIKLADKPFSSGGEGEIRRILFPARYSNKCVKIYYEKGRTATQEKKVKFMSENPPNLIQNDGFMIGWPITSVYGIDGGFLGFMMPLAFDGSKELVYLTSKNLNLKRLGIEWSVFSRENGKSAIVARLKLMNNIAIPIHLLHETNKYVLKDFKPQNVLVTREGKVTIVDMDSVQIVDNGKLLFSGTAATPEYIPPEAYGLGVGTEPHKALDKTWDYFALSVVFYQILFGLHPYVVTPKFQNDDSTNTIQSSISKNLFPFGPNRNQIATYPDLHKNFHILPKEMQELIIRAFSQIKNRPGASEWGKVIHQIVDNVPNIQVEPTKLPRLQPSQPPRPPQGGLIPKKTDNYAVLAVIALFAFFPLGIPALICSMLVNGAFETGNYDKARNLATATKILSAIAIFIGFMFVSMLLGFQ